MAPSSNTNNKKYSSKMDDEDYEDSFTIQTSRMMMDDDDTGGGDHHENRLQLEEETGGKLHIDEHNHQLNDIELQDVDLIKSSNSSTANSREPLKEDGDIADLKINTKKRLSPSEIWSNMKSVLLTKAFLQTMLLNFSILCMCISASSVGSLINVFAKQTNTDRSEVGIVFTIRGVGALVTTLVGGFVMDAMKKYMDKKIKDHHKRTLYETLTNYALIIVSIFIMAISSALMPFGSSLWSLCAIFLLWGVGQGYLGICAQALLFSIWNEMKINVTPFSQLFHFSAGLGLFFGPFTVLVVNSVLGIDNSQVVVPVDEGSEALSILQNNVTLSNNTIIGNVTQGTPAGFIEGTLISKSVLGTNFIVCILYLLSIGLFIVYMVYMWVKRNETTEDVKPINDGEEDDTASVGSIEHGEVKKSATTSSKSEFLIKLFVTILVALALLAYCMAESTFGNVIYSYLTAMELADDNEANMINSGYWLLFTIGRGIAIPISYFVPPFIMLLIDFIGIAISVSLFWIFSTNISVLWVSSLLFGISIASLYPTTISIPSSVMNLEITGLMTSLMVLGGSGGAMTGPYITLALFKKISPKVIFATVTITEVCLALVLISLFIFSRIYNRRRNKKQQEESQSVEKQVSPIE